MDVDGYDKKADDNDDGAMGQAKHNGESNPVCICVYRQFYQIVRPFPVAKMSMGQCFILLLTGYVHSYPPLI